MATVTKIESTRLPCLSPPTIEDDTMLSEWIYETIDWLGLVQVGSPRVREGDTPDSYLTRYALPESAASKGVTLYLMRWFGLVNTAFITGLLVELR